MNPTNPIPTTNPNDMHVVCPETPSKDYDCISIRGPTDYTNYECFLIAYLIKHMDRVIAVCPTSLLHPSDTREELCTLIYLKNQWSDGDRNNYPSTGVVRVVKEPKLNRYSCISVRGPNETEPHDKSYTCFLIAWITKYNNTIMSVSQLTQVPRGTRTNPTDSSLEKCTKIYFKDR